MFAAEQGRLFEELSIRKFDKKFYENVYKKAKTLKQKNELRRLFWECRRKINKIKAPYEEKYQQIIEDEDEN